MTITGLDLTDMPTATLETAWNPAHTKRAEAVWSDYREQHDLGDLIGQVAAVEPETGRVWIGDSGVDVAAQMESDGVTSPVYLFRIGSEHYLRKGRR